MRPPRILEAPSHVLADEVLDTGRTNIYAFFIPPETTLVLRDQRWLQWVPVFVVVMIGLVLRFIAKRPPRPPESKP